MTTKQLMTFLMTPQKTHIIMVDENAPLLGAKYQIKIILNVM